MPLRIIISVLLGLTLLGTALFIVRQPITQSDLPLSPIRTPTVLVAPVVLTTVERETRYSAITQPVRQAALSFTLSGRIHRRLVDIGDRVFAGQVLATLDIHEFENVLRQAEALVVELSAQLAQAERDHHRFALLSKDQIVESRLSEQSTALYEQLQAALSGAENRRAEALRRRNETFLRAPFPGVVAAVQMEQGEWIEPGRPVLELVDDQRIELELEVPENVIGGLEQGQNIQVHLPFSRDISVTGKIKHLAQVGRTPGRLFPVRIELDPASGLIPGMTAEVTLRTQAQASLLIPVGAIVNPGGTRPSVFVLEDQRVREVHILPEAFSADQVIVSGDLVAGDLVVVSGQTMLSDGMLVEIAL